MALRKPKPKLSPEVMKEFELRGVDTMRALNARSTDGYSGTSRKVSIDLGNMTVTRDQIEDWLNWKASIETLWIRVGVIAAMIAALFSLYTNRDDASPCRSYPLKFIPSLVVLRRCRAELLHRKRNLSEGKFHGGYGELDSSF